MILGLSYIAKPQIAKVYGVWDHGDTLINVELNEIIVYGPYRFKNVKEQERYNRLVRNVRIVYPYALMIKAEITMIEKELDNIPDEKQRKLVLKGKKEQLWKCYSPILKKFSLNQGKIMMKLLDRQSGKSTYSLVQKYDGTFKAFFWNGIATLLGANMKKRYAPNSDDAMIEHIVILIENGQL